MKLKLFLRNNKFFSLISIFFVCWLIFLIVLAIIGSRQVIFWEAISGTDVSSNYSSSLPIFRYLLEPFAAISFILEMEFTWLFLVLIFYPIFRIIHIIFKKKSRFVSEKYKYLTYPLIDLIHFSFKVLSLSVIIIGLIMLFGFIIQGFYFVGRYFMIPVQIGVHVSIILIVIKAFYILLKLFHPNLKLNYSKIKKKKKERRKKKSLIIAKKEFSYLAGIIVLMLGINIVLISTPFSTHKIISIIPLEDDEFLFDFHVHTTFSDGWLTPEERVLWYIDQGISGAAFSDHDNIRGALAAQEFVEKNGLDFVVFMAEEWTDHENDIHMNYFGLAEEIVPLESFTPGGPKAMNASDLISYVKVNGGYITVNHYNYDDNSSGGFGVPYTLDQLKNWGIDGFEIVNGGSYGTKYQQIRNYCLSNNLTCIAGSDIHTNEPLNTFIKIKLLDPTNLTITNIFETLKTNLNHEVIAVDLNPKIVDFPGDINDLGFYVIQDFINYILNMDIFQCLSWILWSAGIYLIFFLGYRKIKKVDLESLKNKIL